MVGSLLLGLWNDAGQLQHVASPRRSPPRSAPELVAFLEPYRKDALKDHPWKEWREWEESAAASGRRLPGATSRWNRGKDLSWEPLRAELVCEVAFDHLQGDRFRHGTTFKRWRPDKPAADCRYDQLEETPAALLADLFGAATPLTFGPPRGTVWLRLTSLTPPFRELAAAPDSPFAPPVAFKLQSPSSGARPSSTLSRPPSTDHTGDDVKSPRPISQVASAAAVYSASITECDQSMVVEAEAGAHG